MFKNFILFRDYIEEKGAVFFPEFFDWAKDIAKLLPDLSLDLPNIEKKSKIEFIFDKKNPIYMQLTDGSKLYFTNSEFKRIKGKPEKGKNIIVKMLRLSTDKSENPSQIISCEVT